MIFDARRSGNPQRQVQNAERFPSWPKERDWKSRRWLNPASRVRIPPSPPCSLPPGDPGDSNRRRRRMGGGTPSPRTTREGMSPKSATLGARQAATRPEGRWRRPPSLIGRIPPSPPSLWNRSPARRGAGKKRGGTRKNEETFPVVRSTSRVRPCGTLLQEEGAAAGHAAEAGGNARPVRRTARPDGGRTGKEGRRARGRQEGLDGREDRGGVQGEESEETVHHPGGLRIQGARHRPDPEDRPLPPPFRDDGRPDHFRLRRSVQPGLQHRDPGGGGPGVQGMAFPPVSGHPPVRARQIRSETAGGREKVTPLSGGPFRGARRPRRRVPGVKLQPPDPVEPAAGEVAHVEGRGAVAPDRLSREDEFPEEVEVVVGRLLHVVGEAGGEEGAAQVLDPGHRDGFPVAKGPPPRRW